MSGTAVCCEKEEISFYSITEKLFYGKQVGLTPAYYTNEANKDIYPCIFKTYQISCVSLYKHKLYFVF